MKSFRPKQSLSKIQILEQQLSQLKQQQENKTYKNARKQTQQFDKNSVFGTSGTKQYLDDKYRQRNQQYEDFVDDNCDQKYDLALNLQEEDVQNDNQQIDIENLSTNVSQQQQQQQKIQNIINDDISSKRSSQISSSGGINEKKQLDVKLMTASFPINVQNIKSQKKYEINLNYILNNDVKKKIHKRKIKFGLKGKDDFIEHNDQAKKRTLLKRLQKQDYILSGNFWRKNILNNKTNSIYDNFTLTMKEYLYT